MERELPVFVIQETEFFVDVSRTELRQKDDPKNVIGFNDMDDKGSHYIFHYDPITKNIANYIAFNHRKFAADENWLIWDPWPDSRQEFQLSESVNTVIIPQMIHLDPPGMSLTYSVPVESFTGKTDFDIMVNQDLYKKRLDALPTMDVLGCEFCIDVIRECIYPVQQATNSGRREGIYLADYDLLNGQDYTVYYDTVKRKALSVDNSFNTALDMPDLVKLPKNIVVLNIPNENKLDPVGVARRNGLDERNYIRKFPIQEKENLKVTLVPWNETPYPARIKNNVIREKELKMERRKKGKNNGKGL